MAAHPADDYVAEGGRPKVPDEERKGIVPRLADHYRQEGEQNQFRKLLSD